MNYEIIKNKDELLQFINFLPELKKDEIYYVVLLARRKYYNLLDVDKVQLKRFTSNKLFLYDKIKQLECEIGSYKYNNKDIPNEALSLYITINPRDQRLAAKNSIKMLSEMIFNNDNYYNIQQEILTEIQKSKSRTIFIDFDLDIPQNKNIIISEIISSLNINKDAIIVIDTHSGYHLLVEIDKIKDEYKKTYYNELKKVKYIDQVGDLIIPIPGCSQGGYTPILIN